MGRRRSFGTSDDLTVYDYAQVARAIYSESLSLVVLNDDTLLDAFIAR